MAVSDASVGCLLENVTHILTYSYHLRADVRESIENLKTQLSSLQSLLVDSDYCDDDSRFMEMRTTLDEAEDAVDSCILQATYRRLRGMLIKLYYDSDNYPVVIGNVSKDLEAIAAKVKLFNQDDYIVMPGLQHQKLTKLNRSEALQVEEEYVIGFKEAAEEVEKLLLQGNEHLETVSLVGMLGLGKTTLAKNVYEAFMVNKEFMDKAFVYVSQEYDKREVLLQILTSVSKSNEGVKSLNEEQLEKHVYQVLEGKQYLVVLDDVWEQKDWDGLKGAFPNNKKKRCRVLITTHSVEVAEYANQNLNSLYRLDFLPLEESRKLLRWRVFQQKGIADIPKELERYEIEIATKCSGLPLALVVIAGILVNHSHEADWWQDVANSMKGYIAKDVKQITMVIELMYKHLPSYLKQCFLYLGVFHRDSEILVWKLVRLWISEGFIPQEIGINLEDSAEQCLKDLIHRNLVIVGKMRKDGRIKTCRMHDTLREFCKKEAAKGNIFQEIKENNLNKFLNNEPAPDQYRRLCNNGTNISQYISRTRRGKYVRSFLSFVKEGTNADGELFPTIPRAFKLMKVLEIQALVFTRFPPDICSLVLLKYLSMSSTFSSLPAAMSNLWNLHSYSKYYLSHPFHQSRLTKDATIQAFAYQCISHFVQL